MTPKTRSAPPPRQPEAIPARHTPTHPCVMPMVSRGVDEFSHPFEALSGAECRSRRIHAAVVVDPNPLSLHPERRLRRERRRIQVLGAHGHRRPCTFAVDAPRLQRHPCELRRHIPWRTAGQGVHRPRSRPRRAWVSLRCGRVGVHNPPTTFRCPRIRRGWWDARQLMHTPLGSPLRHWSSRRPRTQMEGSLHPKTAC